MVHDKQQNIWNDYYTVQILMGGNIDELGVGKF